MTDFLHKMLQNSIDREAKKIVSSSGATEQDRYGHLLDSVKGRDIDKEESDSYHDRLSNIHKNAEENRKQREKESAECSRNIQRIIRDAETRDRRDADDFLTKHHDRLNKAKETINKERDKNYFS